MAAALVTYRLEGGRIADAARRRRRRRGAAAAHPEAEAVLNGKSAGMPTFVAAAEAAAGAIDPLEDHQTNADYRRDLVRAVVRRALEQSTSHERPWHPRLRHAPGSAARSGGWKTRRWSPVKDGSPPICRPRTGSAFVRSPVAAGRIRQIIGVRTARW